MLNRARLLFLEGDKCSLTVPIHIKRFFHTTNICIRKVSLIQIFQKETQAADGQDGEVKFAEQSSLRWRFQVCICIPYERTE